MHHFHLAIELYSISLSHILHWQAYNPFGSNDITVVPSSKSFISSDCTAEWTVSFSWSCLVWIASVPRDSSPHLAYRSYPPPATSHSFSLLASFTSLYCISSPPSTFPLSHRKVDSHSHLFYFIFLFIHIFRHPFLVVDHLVCCVAAFLPTMTLPTAHTFGFLAHCLISPSSCCNNNSPTLRRLSSYNRTPCLEPSGFL